MSDSDQIYSDLAFPFGSEERPYAFIDMVTTIDGKILSGDREDHVIDLGSSLDHTLMKRIASQADAVLVGSNTLRTTLSSWDPGTERRVVVSSSGRDLPYESAFFRTGEGYVAVPEDSTFTAPQGVGTIAKGRGTTDLRAVLKLLKGLGVERLLVLGGSELNAQVLHLDLIDELFVTIAPKVKLGRDVPTYADGVALPREGLLRYRIVESHVVDNEVFLRYRRDHEE
jgi:riboflavin biosynthesis pyrimidine reductase